jgi:biotin carboxyl carrier protein
VLDELAYRVAQAQKSAQSATGTAVITSPMPGLVLKVLVDEGAIVDEGEKVIILESMKMENELRAPRAGIVQKVYVTGGESVEKDHKLLTIGDPDDASHG